jgi:hypothetical protein
VIRRGILLGLIAALAQLAGAAAAQDPQYPGGYRPQFEEDKPWEEQKWALPPYPAEGDLVRFDVGNNSAFQFFVDSKSVSVDKDGVVRYTLVARSASGALNVSYEGIRCESHERKLYAFGRADRTWAQARNAEWARIASAKTYPNNQHAVLAEEFFCPAQGGVRNTEDAIASLRRRR